MYFAILWHAWDSSKVIMLGFYFLYFAVNVNFFEKVPLPLRNATGLRLLIMRMHMLKVGIKASSQYDTNATLHYDVMLKCWNKLEFYSSIASITSEQLT